MYLYWPMKRPHEDVLLLGIVSHYQGKARRWEGSRRHFSLRNLKFTMKMSETLEIDETC